MKTYGDCLLQTRKLIDLLETKRKEAQTLGETEFAQPMNLALAALRRIPGLTPAVYPPPPVLYWAAFKEALSAWEAINCIPYSTVKGELNDEVLWLLTDLWGL